MTAPITVLVVDDHKMFVDGVVAKLATEPAIRVVATAATGQQAVDAAVRYAPDVILLDHLLPDEDGDVVTARILAVLPGTHVIIVTQLADEGAIARAVEAGCSGYLTKDRPMEDVVSAIRSAATGEVTVSPAMLTRLLRRMQRPSRTIGESLTPRELEVLQLLAQGLGNAAIATRLSISNSTVRNHASAILQKLGAHSELEAVLIGMRERIVDVPRRSPST